MFEIVDNESARYGDQGRGRRRRRRQRRRSHDSQWRERRGVHLRQHRRAGARPRYRQDADPARLVGAGRRGEAGAGQAAAMEQREAIREALGGAHMVFITAGMGGGTGTGAAPVVAEVAKEMGILTVAVVTKPFEFEGKRMRVAEAGLDELQQHVDSLIVILNERLMEVLGEDVSMKEAFRAADDVLHNAVAGIAEIINSPGLVNVDFEDVKTVMGEMGMAMMGSAHASGVDRARIAAEQAVASPLLEGVNLSGARGVLVNITANETAQDARSERGDEHRAQLRRGGRDHHLRRGLRRGDGRESARHGGGDRARGARQPARQQKPQLVVSRVTGTDSARPMPQGTVDYGHIADVPAVIRRRSAAAVEALQSSGMDQLDIPAFLRKQAD